jgi:uncharacterized membrane protein
MIGLGLPEDWFPEFEDSHSFASGATACSGNGDIVTGYVVENENGNLKGYRWDASTGLVKLIDDGYCAGRDISYDGGIITGETYTGFLTAAAFSWNNGSLTALYNSGVQTLGWGMSHDGQTYAGTYGGFPSQAFLYSEAGFELLGDIPGGPEWSGANALSGDGTTAVGYGSDHDNFQDQYQATRWTRDTGMVGLGRLPGTRLSSAFGVSRNGSTVVGYCWDSGNSLAEKAFIWTPAEGMRDLKAVLQSQGVDLTGWRLNIAYAVSDDGRTIVGNASFGFHSEAFVAHLAATCGCAADYDQNGGVDGSDVEAFFNDWSNGVGCADVNQDGGIDGSDVESFFRVWEAGGCN